MIASGTVWSLPPMVSSSGPRSSLFVSTLVSACGLKLALAAWNSGRAGEGIVHLSNSSPDSSSSDALPKPYWNCSLVSEIAASMLPGFFRAMNATRSAEMGSGQDTLDRRRVDRDAGHGVVSPSSFSTSSPPKECPTRIGLDGSFEM